MNPLGTLPRHGTGAEHVLKYEMVTAKGEIITVSNSNVTMNFDADGNMIVSSSW